jgi:iron complex outermembrane recepter protein
MTTRTVALLLSGAAAMALFSPAFAAPAPAPAAAPAAEAASDETGIQEIVVTAQKRTENLETVPVAISAFTSKERDLIGIETIQDMTNFTPGLAYNTYLDRAFIRGVGRETNNLSTQPGVATYSDGLYNTSVVAASGDSLFTDRIEILRGPQSTLYGRNSIGGTINSISKRPTADWEAEVRADFGNYGVHNFEGSLSGPINDTMRFRFAGYRNTQNSGYFTDVYNGKEFGGIGNYFYWEAQFEWDITPDVEFWLKGDQLGYNQSYLFSNTNGSYDYAPYPSGTLGPSPGFGCALTGGAAGICTNPGQSNIRDLAYNTPSHATLTRTYQINPQLTWHTPWAADVKYVGGYTTYLYQLWQDNDGTSINSYVYPVIPGSGMCGPGIDCPPLVVYPQYQSLYVENKKYFSNEINVTSHSDSNLQWIVGLYQYNERFEQPVNVQMSQQATMPQFNGSPCPNGVGCITSPYNLTVTGLAAPNPNANIYYVNSQMHGNSYAVFAQTDWKFQPTWKLTTGVRYTEDFLAGSEYARELCFGIPSCLNLPPTPPLFPFPGGITGPALFGAFTPVNDITSALIAMGNYRGVTHLPTLNPATGYWGRGLGDKWDAVTGTMGVEWTPVDGTLGYAKYSRGYKSGGFNAGFGGAIAPSPEFAPETINAFEVGAKQVWKSLQINGALYFYNYENLQIPLPFQPLIGPAYTTSVNIPRVASYGAELETIWQPITDLQFLLDYSYMEAEIRSNSLFQNAVVGGPNQDPIGQTVPESPRNKVAVNGNYTYHFTPGSVNFSLSYIWKAKTYDSIFNEYYNLAPAYSQVDSRLTWTDAANRYTVFIYGKNLQNHLGYDGVAGYHITNTNSNPLAPAVAGIGSTEGLTPPRTYGVEIQFRLK